MNSTIERLLQPVSADQPCGPDLAYDPRFDGLENLLKGKPEVEFGSNQKPAEPPDWQQLKDQSSAILGATKHLRPCVILCCALLKVDGLGGFRDGLQLLRGLLEQYWPVIHPLLDPDDGDDPQQRLNILGALTAPRGTVTGWLQILEGLYTAPLCRPKGVKPITLDDIDSAGASWASALDHQFRSAKPEEISANFKTVEEALAALHGIDTFLTSTLTSKRTIGFENLEGVLNQMLKMLAAKLPVTADGSEGATVEASSGDDGGSYGGSAPTGSAPGVIRSRTDVVRALDGLCDYYRQCEPGSPVPLLLRRAQKLVSMNFIEAMQELSLATPEQLRPTMGSVVMPEPGSVAESSPVS